MNMYFLCITCLIISVTKVFTADETKIFNYFKSDTFRTIQDHWQTERKAFENALTLILQQDYGYGGMNVYVRSMTDIYMISRGFLFSDNIVNLVLLETRLQKLPIMIAPEVTFALASNYLHIRSELGRIVMESSYLLIRNQSDVVFTAAEQDASKKSPFSFEQVQDSGELTIIAEECTVEGYAISSFVGNTVSLGLDTFKVTNCKFSLEIYSSGVGSPPVFGPYFSEKQSLALEAMLSKPIRAELMPKLQASVFSYVNISVIFGDKLPQLRSQQNSVFKESSNYMNGLVKNFVQNTIKGTQGVLKLMPLDLLWKITRSEGICENRLKLKNVTLYGLDTAYSAHIGGPFKVKSPFVAEAIRFSTMQVRGNIYFGNNSVNGSHDFAVELKDVAVNILMKAKGKSFNLDSTNIFVTGWRTLDFSILDMQMLGYERKAAESFITGYLINELPKRLLDHISKRFKNVGSKTDTEIIDDNKQKITTTEDIDSDSFYYESSSAGSEQGSQTEQNSVEDEKKRVVKSSSSNSEQDLPVKENSSLEGGIKSAANPDSSDLDPVRLSNTDISSEQPYEQRSSSGKDQSSKEGGSDSSKQLSSNLLDNEVHK